jgi:hypothetical protein
MSTDAEEQADEAASLEAIFGEDIEYDAGLSAYRVRPHWQQPEMLQEQQQAKAEAQHCNRTAQASQHRQHKRNHELWRS